MKKAALFLGIAALLVILPNASGAIVTITQSVCNTGDANVTWYDGNTYFLNVDGNVDIENCQLTILPGAVVKYVASGPINPGSFLRILNKGVLKAQGTSASKIVFTSQNDDSVGQIITGSTGTPVPADYNTAIWFSNSAGITSDANSFSDLNIGFAMQALVIRRYIGEIHDNNIHDNNGGSLSGVGIVVSTGTVDNMYNNTVKNNRATSGRRVGVNIDGGTVRNFYHNTITNNSSNGTAPGMYLINSTNNFYGNIISWNDTGSSGSDVGGLVLGGTATITNFYDNTLNNNGGAWGGAMQCSSTLTTTITNFYNNTFNDNNAGRGAGLYVGCGITNLYNNTFSNNSTTSNGAGIWVEKTILNFYDNTISSNSSATNGGGMYVISGIESFYNNLLKNNSADINGGGIYDKNIIQYFYNNTFFNNSAADGGAIHTQDSNGILRNAYNNIFAYNTGTAVSTSGGELDSNFNAFWANDTNTAGYTEGTQSVYLGATPFASDSTTDTNSDRNFLLNTYGITQLQGKGNSATGTDSWFAARTIRADNRLDYNRSIGWHADQNSPYISIINPQVGSYSGNVLIDFNVSSNAANANVAIDLNLLKSATQDQNAFYLYQNYASWTCSQNLPTTTKDGNCTYVLDSTTIADTNYLAQAKATDNNGTGKSILLNSFQVQNDSQAPDMNNDANANWQNTDANVRIWCDDASKGNSDINSIAINKDNNGWLFFSKSALSVKRTDQNAYFTTDMNHSLQYFCSDSRGNTTDTNTIYVLVDKTSPILTLTITSITSVGLNATITYTASATGGIKKYWISTNSGNSWTDNSTNTSYTFSISAGTKLPHTQIIWIKATNNSDQNTTIQTATIRFESATGGATYCGDKKCSGNETPANCQIDCAPICGDGACTGNETTQTCQEDCAKICGDTYCTTDENCSNCSEDCGTCYDPPEIEGIIISQTTAEANPTTQQITAALQQLNLEQLIAQAMSIMQNYKIKRTITISQLQDNSYRTTITITTAINPNIQLTGMTLLEIVPKSAAQNASEITTKNDIVILQEDPAIEFIATGKLEKEINFSYSINKRIENTADFTAPIILNQVIKTITTCATGCNDNNPCTKDQCLGQSCVHFLLPENTPCGYAQQCRKGICITTQTTKYSPPLTIFGQRMEIIILIIGIILAFTAIGTHYYGKYKKKPE